MAYTIKFHFEGCFQSSSNFRTTEEITVVFDHFPEEYNIEDMGRLTPSIEESIEIFSVRWWGTSRDECEYPIGLSEAILAECWKKVRILQEEEQEGAPPCDYYDYSFDFHYQDAA